MLRRQNLRTFRVNFPVTNSDLIDPVHQLRDEIKIETGGPERCDLSLRSDNDMRVFNRVIEVVPGHRSGIVICASSHFKGDAGPSVSRSDGLDRRRLECDGWEAVFPCAYPCSAPRLRSRLFFYLLFALRLRFRVSALLLLSGLL